MARGLGKGFTPAHIHSYLGLYTNRIAHSGGRDWVKEGVKGMKLCDHCKVSQTDPQQTQPRAVMLCDFHQHLSSRSHVLLPSPGE